MRGPLCTLTSALCHSKERPDGLGERTEDATQPAALMPSQLLEPTRQSLNQSCSDVRAGGSSFLLPTLVKKEKEIKSFPSQTTFPAS